jgi:WD40 repeat protein
LVYESTDADEREVTSAHYMRHASKRLLRSSLSAHVAEFHVSAERLLTVEYAPSLPRPSDGARTPMPEWIGAVEGLQPSVGSSSARFVTGGYDGKLRVTSGGASTFEVDGHSGAIKAISSCGGMVVSGGHDKVVRVWALGDGGGALTATARGGDHGAPGGSRLGHENSVECVAVRADGFVLSGDWDGRLCLWKAGGADGEVADAGDGAGRSISAGALKKRKGDGDGRTSAGASLVELGAAAAWRAHAQCVSAVAWMGDGGGGLGGGEGSGAAAVTASWDHSLRTWDVERQDGVFTANGAKVNTCLAYSPEAGLAATGHPDGTVRWWDFRSGVAAATAHSAPSTSTGAGPWVSGVAWCPGSAPLVAASTHDGAVRLFDLRNPKPL